MVFLLFLMSEPSQAMSGLATTMTGRLEGRLRSISVLLVSELPLLSSKLELPRKGGVVGSPT
jgi:hypothetical protein